MNGRSTRYILATGAALVCSWLPAGARQAAADTATPTVAAPASTAIPTPTAVLAPTAFPTVVQESSSPVATQVVPTVPTVAQSTPTVASYAVPTSTAPASVPTPTPVAASSTDPWPSAQDLQTDARLRWGNGIPASVRRWAFLIVPAARQYGLDPNLIAAVMTMESNGDPLALSYADAHGLMQILHGPWDPKQNVDEGAQMLAQLYNEFGSWRLALAAYNAGPGAVESAGGIPAIRETRDYVIIVMYLWALFSHHRITDAQRAQYRHTLQDLATYKDQRHKVAPLSRVARVPVTLPSEDVVTICTGTNCDSAQSGSAFDSLDPFWPLGDVPDPLQRVDPNATTH